VREVEVAKGRMPEKEPAERPRAKLALDRFAWEGGDRDRWLNVEDTLHLIIGVRGVDGSQARTHLIEAASDTGRTSSGITTYMANGRHPLARSRG